MKLHRILLAFVAAVMLMTGFTACSTEGEDWYPAGMTLASSEDADYSLWVPKDWTLDIQNGIAAAYCNDNDRANVTAVAFNLRDDPYTTPAEYWEGNYELLTQTFSDLTMVGEGEETVINNVPAVKYTYTATVTGQTYRYMQLIAVRAGYVYLFTFTAADGEVFSAHTEVFDSIISNITFKG